MKKEDNGDWKNFDNAYNSCKKDNYEDLDVNIIYDNTEKKIEWIF